MSDNTRTVSVIVSFLNEERFIREAIESVLSQSWTDWELLLVDDGSTDGSTAIALEYCRLYPSKVRYLEHPGHTNRGVAASRNLGFYHSQGRYVAILDADDVWLPDKLKEQVAVLNGNLGVSVVFGRDRYWYSWNRMSDNAEDFEPRLGVTERRLIQPPQALAQFLTGKLAVPCPSGILARYEAIESVGGFEESFIGPYMVYEDQAFFAKVMLREPVIAEDACWTLYRQHPDSNCAVAESTAKAVEARRFYLSWLEKYLLQQNVDDRSIWRGLRSAKMRLDYPNLARFSRGIVGIFEKLRSSAQ